MGEFKYREGQQQEDYQQGDPGAENIGVLPDEADL